MAKDKKGFLSIDWRWVVAGYCYLVLFHLFPMYLLGGIIGSVDLLLPGESVRASAELPDVTLIWMLAGIAIIAFVVGWRSKGFTILEPACSGVLYALTVTFAFHELASSRVHGREMLATVFWMLIVVILSVGSAWIGEAVQRWKPRQV